MKKRISVYAPNLANRSDRRASLEAQFSGKEEFDLTIVTPVESRCGAWSLWQTFYGIVRQEAAKQSGYFIFCEDDHVFTKDYSFDRLADAISRADALNADILSGGMSWLRTPVQVSDCLFHVECFNGLQFTVVFSRFYETILSYCTEKGHVTDKFISEISGNIFVIYPYISIQTDFGYSDVTPSNNNRGRITEHFRNADSNAGKYYAATLKYGVGDRMLFNRCGDEFREYFCGEGTKALQIGCGTNLLAGWLNTDINPVKGAMYLNAARKFPLCDNSLDCIFSEHQMEHLSYYDGKTMLEECFRTLKSGGTLRITMPSLEFLAGL
ncbi:MAG: methyltransferase domain-containing protein [Bacteroidaceae bacterium]|nr:methyltransferase domain-containing protein [Bacteroidaceae bacterium]